MLNNCICGYSGKLKGQHTFGWLSIICPKCTRKLTARTRSGNSDYILNRELYKRWNIGESDARSGDE